VRHPHLLRTVALVIVDELQMLGDPERGPGLELSLTKLLASAPRPQLLGLSAVLREAQQVADWLEADLLFQEDRPVELYRGVLLGGQLRYRAYNSGEEGEEQLARIDTEDPREILFANVKHFVEKGEQLLIFLKGKRDTVQCALALAEMLALPPAQEALTALDPLEETALKAQLRTAFAGGVAFHHADLTPEERALVETYYRSGALRVIACTTTLAFGVNLPATTVFIEAVKWDADQRTGAAIEVPISWAEYENISGRAGRLGFHEEFGRSILIAANQFQADLLWRSYVMGEQEQFTPAPGQAGLADRVLNLLAAKVCINKTELQTFFGLTYLGFQQRGKATVLMAEVEKALEALVSSHLVTLSEDGRLEATTLGEVAARKGIRAATAVRLARFFEAARGRPIPGLELLHLLSLTEEGKKVHLPLSVAEHRGRVYESRISEHVHESGEEPGEGLGRLLNSRMLPTAQEARSAKLALLLLGWTKGENLSGLESRYQCYAGTIMALTDEVSWLVDAAAEIAEVMGWTPTTQLSELAECMRFGVDPACLPLARAQLPGLGREDLKTLVAAGFNSPAALREAPPEVLQQYLSPSQIQTLQLVNAA
jgi:ATP-dependent DNA helicase